MIFSTRQGENMPGFWRRLLSAVADSSSDHDETVRARHVQSLLRQQYEVECLLAEALGYSYDREYGWVTGDHTLVTLAEEVRSRGVLPTREALALAYHRYHCHNTDPHTCTAVDQDDYDYADALAEVLAMGHQGGLT